MDRIILFDIDKTLFDRERFMSDFYDLIGSGFGLTDSQKLNIKENYYQDIKNNFGFFSEQAFLIKIYENFPKLAGKLDYYFESENINKYLFEDTKILYDLKNIRIGIFSKGDINYQKKKIFKLSEVFEEDLIYIFHDKINKLPEIINHHKNSQIFIVDDSLEVLLAVKREDEYVKTIFMDRESKYPEVNGIDFKLNFLSGIISILNE